MKQTLFAILEPGLRGRRFLDLFAGSGAGGIEALSRGATEAVLVERDRDAVAVIERNLGATRLDARAHVVRAEVAGWLARQARSAGPFAAILVDPPYDAPSDLEDALREIADAGRGTILAADGVIVAKHSRGTLPGANIGLLRSIRERRFGETTLTFLRWADEEDG